MGGQRIHGGAVASSDVVGRTTERPCRCWDVGVGLQVLGLGGKMMLDYEPDTRAPHLNLFEDDYLDFDGACMGGGSVGWRTVGRREERG